MRRIPILKIAYIIFSLTLIQPTIVNAVTVKTQEELSIDTSITREDLSYSTPESIVIVPIFQQDDTVNMNSNRRYRGLYYYLIQKLGFSDIPFHYVVSQSGEVYEGNSGGDEREVHVEGIGNNILLIGYLADSLRSSFDPRSTASLIDLLTDVANRNSINPNRIQISGLKFVRDQEKQTVNMSKSELFGNWNIAVKNLIDEVAPRYSPTQKSYSAEVMQVTLPTEELVAGEETVVSVRIKNTGTTGMYGGSNSEIVLTKQDGSRSLFFIENEWLSNSQVSIMVDNRNLLPGLEDIFDFKVKAPLHIGEITEVFELRTLNGNRIESGTVELKVNVKRGDKRIVEIQNTELGYLRVRGEPSTVGNEIGRVSSGERFFVLEDAGNGFIRIDLGEGKSGWVASWLTNNI